MACCPIAQYVAVGTVSGHVLFIELTREQQPRLVHRVHLYYTPVDHLLQVSPMSLLLLFAFWLSLLSNVKEPFKGISVQ